MTPDEYEAALARLYELTRIAAPGTPLADRRELLAALVRQYEDEHYPMGEADPSAIVDFMLEQKGLHRFDVAELIGGDHGAAEFFDGRRALTTDEAEALGARLKIPPDLLTVVRGDG